MTVLLQSFYKIQNKISCSVKKCLSSKADLHLVQMDLLYLNYTWPLVKWTFCT